MAKKTKVKDAPKDTAARKANKAALAKGAAEIKKAKGAAEPPAADGKFQVVEGQSDLPLEIVPSDRPINDILAEKIKIMEGGVGLEIDDSLTAEEWVPVVSHFAGLMEHIGFFVGDLFAYGESHFGKNYGAAVTATKLHYKTLVNYTSTSAAVPPENRNPQLTWSHHNEVAKLDVKKQKAVLDKAQKKGLTVKQLREEVQKLTPKKLPKKAPATTPAAKSSTPVTATEEEMNFAGAEENGEIGGIAGGTKASNVEQKLSAEDAAKNDSMIEISDTLLDYVRSATVSNAPLLVRRQWRNILKPFALRYEDFISEIGKD